MMTLPVLEVRLAHGRQGNRRYGVDFLVSSVEYQIVWHLAWLLDRKAALFCGFHTVASKLSVIPDLCYNAYGMIR